MTSSRWGGCSPDAAAPMNTTPTTPDNPNSPEVVGEKRLTPEEAAVIEAAVQWSRFEGADADVDVAVTNYLARGPV